MTYKESWNDLTVSSLLFVDTNQQPTNDRKTAWPVEQNGITAVHKTPYSRPYIKEKAVWQCETSVSQLLSGTNLVKNYS